MFRRCIFTTVGFLALIALGCGGTTSNAGGGATVGADTTSDSTVSDAVGDATDPCNDTNGCDADGSAGTDALGGTDGAAGTDAVGADALDADVAASTCPPVLKDKTLGKHAQTCAQNSDCAYGLCQKGGFLVGYDASLGYCTKDCACNDPAAQCSNDNADGKEFLCGFEMSQSGGNPKANVPPQKRCSLRCKSDGDCAAWNPALPHCIGSTKYVSSAGVCGFDPLK